MTTARILRAPVYGWLRRLLGRLWWRVAIPTWQQCVLGAARFYRPGLRRLTVIAVTGSCGKTTTKDLIAAVLSACYAGRKNPQSWNEPYPIAKTVLRCRPRDAFLAQEVAAWGPGSLGRSLRLLQPRIGVVTTVGADHFNAFRTLEAVAAEKGKLVASLPPGGVAILNGDDAHVVGMQSQTRARVITYGLSSGAMLRAEDVSSAWPARLSFGLVWEGQRFPVRTQLCGTHWVPSVLAALAVGVAMDVPITAALEAVAGVEPTPGRMSPVIHDDGVTFIRDDWKAPLWTIPPALEFLREATAARKIVVIGTISDFRGKGGQNIYVKVAREALRVADYVFFVGPQSSRCLGAKRHPADDAVRAFGTAREASVFLCTFFQSGDLVLLKGSNPADHLVRIVLARTQVIGCWLARCGKRDLCDGCGMLLIPSEAPGASSAGNESLPDPPGSSWAPPVGNSVSTPCAVVGLGNPGERFRGARHNIGHRVLDVMAQSLNAAWSHEGNAAVARSEWRGTPVYLVKPLRAMNESGPVILRMARHLGVEPSRCILVHDDLDFPPGVVRVRMGGGGGGGHKGIQSILHAFQSDRFQRIRVGIGRPERRQDVPTYVLEPFADSERSAIDRACTEAADRALELVSACGKTEGA